MVRKCAIKKIQLLRGNKFSIIKEACINDGSISEVSLSFRRFIDNCNHYENFNKLVNLTITDSLTVMLYNLT